jgi:CheY-like chemotaxis protein
MSGEEEALGFLKILVAREELEIEDGQRLESLAVGARDVLSLPISAERKAEALSTWLLDQPAVADLYIADDDLAEVLAEW